MLMDTSGLGDIYIKDDDSYFVKMLIYLSIMLYIDYVTLIMSLWDLYYLVAIPHTPDFGKVASKIDGVMVEFLEDW
jgi:hypothetical protein